MRCPNCQQEIPDTARFCGHCGHSIAVETAAPPPPPQPLQPPEPVAPAPVTPPVAAPPSPKLKRGVPGWVWGLAGVVIVVAVGVALLATGVINLPGQQAVAPVPTAASQACQVSTSGWLETKSPWLKNQVTFDGKMTTAEEWSDAVCLDLTLLEKREGPATVPSRWWIKNDAQWVYPKAHTSG